MASVLCLMSHVVVDGVHFGLDASSQFSQVVLVRHACRLDRIENANGGVARKKHLRSGRGDSLRPLYHDREQRESRIDGNAEGAFLEREERTAVTPGTFGKYEQRIAAISRDLHALVDRLARGSALLPVDFDYPDRAHGVGDERDLENFLLGEETAPQRERADQQRYIEHGEMIRRDDVPLRRINLVSAQNFDPHRGNSQPHPRPPGQDLVMDRGGRTKSAVHDDGQGRHQGEKEEERDENEGSDTCDESAEHGG